MLRADVVLVRGLEVERTLCVISKCLTCGEIRK